MLEKKFLLILRVADETPLGRIYFSYNVCCINYYVSLLFSLPDFFTTAFVGALYIPNIRSKKEKKDCYITCKKKRGRMSADVECFWEMIIGQYTKGRVLQVVATN